MESESIITAPQVLDTASAYSLWHRTHEGGSDDFYRFMTTPSVERDAFVASAGESVTFNGSVAATMIE